MKKRILLISYYWPPAGGGGVQRWLKMSKYLPEMGYDLTVYTTSNGEAPVVDESLVNEVHPDIKVIQTPIWEPYSLYKKLTGRKKSEKVYSGFITDKKESWTQKLSVFIRGNFFIPDARKFWIRPSITFLKKYLKTNQVDVIISTGPPHSMHLIALGVTKEINIPWIADFRDPWTNIDFYDQLRLTDWADRKHKKLEQKVLANATKVVTVSHSWANDFKRLSNREDILVIPNGFDHTDFEGDKVKLSPTFTLCHIGSMNKDRDPKALWGVLKKLVDAKRLESLEIRLIGQVDHSIFHSIEVNGLTPYLKHIPFMPHDLVITEIRKASVLLLPINDTPNSAGVIPGKLFEYMGANRPILGIGPIDGDSAKILAETHAGVMIDYNDTDSIETEILRLSQDFNSGDLDIDSRGVEVYWRKSLAERYGELFNAV